MSRPISPIGATEATTFAIVGAIDDLDGYGVTQLVGHLEIPKSTVHNYLATLE